MTCSLKRPELAPLKIPPPLNPLRESGLSPPLESHLSAIRKSKLFLMAEQLSFPKGKAFRGGGGDLQGRSDSWQFQAGLFVRTQEILGDLLNRSKGQEHRGLPHPGRSGAGSFMRR